MKNLNRGAGLSLIEVVVAVAMLGLFMLGSTATLANAQRAEGFTREHQHASEAAYRQLDLIMSTPSIDGIATGQRNGSDIATLAFHVAYQGANLIPADAAFVPPNPEAGGGESTMAGHVRVVELDLDGDGAVDDYDLDGRADIVEVRVVVAWREGNGGSSPNRRVDIAARRTR